MADEVRKLAQETTEATKEITNQIHLIQFETTNAISRMNKNKKMVEEELLFIRTGEQSLTTIVKAVKETEHHINEIVPLLSDITTSAENISIMAEDVAAIVEETASSSITTSAENISIMAEDVAAIVEETASSSQEVAAGSEEQSTMIKEMTTYTNDLLNIAEKLNQDVRRFKLI